MMKLFEPLLSFLDFTMFVIVLSAIIMAIKKDFRVTSRHQNYGSKILGGLIVVIFAVVYLVGRLSG